MSTKSNLKNKIKKGNATQSFFESYEANDENKEENNENINNDNDNKLNVTDDNNVVEDNDENNVAINSDIDNDVKTYVDAVVVKNDDDNDYLRELALGKKPSRKKINKVFTSFYMDPDLAYEVDKIAHRGVKGDKSKLINTAIRRLLEDFGVMDKK